MKRFSTIILILAVVLMCSIPANASEPTIISGDFIAEECNPFSNTIPMMPEAPISQEPDVLPRAIVRVLSDYDPSSVTTNDYAFMLGSTTGRNDLSYERDIIITFQFSFTTTISGSVSGGYSVGGEIDMIAGKVNAEYNRQVSASLTFARNTTISCSVPIPPGQTATCDFYNKGCYSSGTLTYFVRDTSGAVQYTESVGAGALLPVVNGFTYHVY